MENQINKAVKGLINMDLVTVGNVIKPQQKANETLDGKEVERTACGLVVDEDSEEFEEREF